MSCRKDRSKSEELFVKFYLPESELKKLVGMEYNLNQLQKSIANLKKDIDNFASHDNLDKGYKCDEVVSSSVVEHVDCNRIR